jgi:hypothetical protein
MRVINRIKAVAIHESTGSSVAVAQEFKQYAPTGIGMVLEQVHGLRGIYVIKVVPGGAAWRANEVLVGDEIRMIDNIVVSDMELDEVTGLILGQPGTEVRGAPGLAPRRRAGGGRGKYRLCGAPLRVWSSSLTLSFFLTHLNLCVRPNAQKHVRRSSCKSCVRTGPPMERSLTVLASSFFPQSFVLP